MDYNIFPYWMGIDSFGELIAAIIVFILLLSMYFFFGGLFCPKNIKMHWVRMLFVMFWPLLVPIILVSIPLIALYEFSKPSDQQKKELSEFLKEEYNRYK